MALEALEQVGWCLMLTEVLYHDQLENLPKVSIFLPPSYLPPAAPSHPLINPHACLQDGPEYQSVRAEAVDTFRLLQDTIGSLREAFVELDSATSTIEEVWGCLIDDSDILVTNGSDGGTFLRACIKYRMIPNTRNTNVFRLKSQ